MTTQIIEPYEGKKYKLDYAKGSAWVRLFKSNTTPTEHSVLGDFTTSTYPGYADQQPTWSTTANDGSDNAESHTGVVTFTCTGGGSSENAYGVLILPDNSGSPGTIVLGCYRFPTPVVMVNNGDVVSFSTIQLLQGQWPL